MPETAEETTESEAERAGDRRVYNDCKPGQRIAAMLGGSQMTVVRTAQVNHDVSPDDDETVTGADGRVQRGFGYRTGQLRSCGVEDANDARASRSAHVCDRPPRLTGFPGVEAEGAFIKVALVT